MSTYISRPEKKKKINRNNKKKTKERKTEEKYIRNKCRHIQQCVYGTLVSPWPPTTLFKDQEQCVYVHNILSPYKKWFSRPPIDAVVTPHDIYVYIRSSINICCVCVSMWYKEGQQKKREEKRKKVNAEKRNRHEVQEESHWDVKNLEEI